MKRFFLFLMTVAIFSCTNNTEDPDAVGQGALHLPVNFDSTYKLCLGRDTLNVIMTDTAGGNVNYLILPDSIPGVKTHEDFIQAVENCFE